MLRFLGLEKTFCFLRKVSHRTVPSLHLCTSVVDNLDKEIKELIGLWLKSVLELESLKHCFLGVFFLCFSFLNLGLLLLEFMLWFQD